MCCTCMCVCNWKRLAVHVLVQMIQTECVFESIYGSLVTFTVCAASLS